MTPEFLLATRYTLIVATEYWPTSNTWKWPDEMKPEERVKFRHALCLYLDKDPAKYPIDGVNSGFTLQSVADYLIDTLSYEEAKDDGPELTEQQAAGLTKLAVVAAKMKHDSGEAGHDGFFDECDHELCKLANELNDALEEKEANGG